MSTNAQPEVAATADAAPEQARAAWLAAAIVLVAAALRLAWPTHVDWDGDFAMHYLRAAELARGERLDVLVGYRTSAGGAHLPALFHYVLALPCLLGAGPLLVTAWVALSDVLAVTLLVTAGRRAWGDRVALAAGALLAVLPAAVLRARSIRNETLLLPLAVLVLLALAAARRRPASRSAGLGLAALGVMPQLHLSALFFLPAAGLALALPLWRGGVRRALPGVGLLLLATLPFVVHETRGGFAETRALLRGAGGEDAPGKPGGSIHADGADRVVAGARSLEDLLSADDSTQFLGPTLGARALSPRPFAWLVAVVALAVPALTLAGLALAFSGRLGPDLRVVGVLFVATLVTFVVGGVAALHPYVVMLLPLACLLAAGAGEAAWRVTSTRGARVGLAVAGGLLLATYAALSLASVAAIGRSGGLLDKQCRGTYPSKRAAMDWVLEHERALSSYPNSQYLLTLDLAWRALPPERRARFTPWPRALPYWDLPFVVPVPAQPVRTVTVVEVAADEALPGVVVAARFGTVAIVEDAPP